MRHAEYLQRAAEAGTTAAHKHQQKLFSGHANARQPCRAGVQTDYERFKAEGGSLVERIKQDGQNEGNGNAKMKAGEWNKFGQPVSGSDLGALRRQLFPAGRIKLFPVRP